MSEWRKYTLEELADDITVGFVGSMASEYIKVGIPFLRSLNVEPLRINQNDIKYISPEFHQRIKKSRLTPGDVVIVRTGKPGACAIVPPWLYDANCSDLVIVRCGSKINNQFLAYYINTVSSGHVASHIVGAVQQHFNVGAARTLPVYLPPLDEQRAIVATLAAFDEKIELNRKMNETLEATARAIFKDWFVDFGPTRAKVAGTKPYLAPEIWNLFPENLDKEGKPKGWLSDRVGDHMLNFDSKRIPVSGGERAKKQGTFPYHGATGVMDYVDDYIFDGTYLLVGEDGSVVKENGLAFTQYVWGKLWVNNHAHVLQGKGAVSTEQLLMFFQHEPVTPYITGAVQLKLSQGRMNSMPFLFPGNEICAEFGKTVSTLFERLRSNIEETRVLTKIRDLLLPKLMSGEIRPRDAESTAEAVLVKAS